MDYDEHSLNSMPTMGPGRDVSTKRPPFPDEPSLGSAPTMGGRTTPQGGRFRPGDVLLGRYTVLAELGEGGMGVVYKCLDTVGGIEVALKCLPPELSRNESEMEGIRENYAIVARLHHSAISGLRQLEKDSEFGEYYLVMDLAKGEDLSTILRRRRGVPMPLDEALAILRPLASALDYAHGEHVLHRDVKPGNVKVETLPAEASRPLTKEEVRSTKDEGAGWGERPTDQLTTDQLITGGRAASPRARVQLLDFGLAAEVRSSMSRVSLRGHAGSSGTPAYMAPEQWEARRQSATTDQYSLAVMAFEMLSGYRPFDTDNMELLKSAVLTRAPEEIEGLPAHVNAALQKALAKNPKERFASCTEFVEAISNAEPQSAQRDSHTETQRHGESISGAAKPVTRIPNSASTPPISEADVLRRKLALTRSLKAIAAEDRADKEFSKFVAKAEDELAVAEEACKFGRFAVAAESLNVAENALCDLQTAKQAREEAERRAREEAERKAREEAERKVREAAERRAREEAERRAWKEARRKAKQEVRENGLAKSSQKTIGGRADLRVGREVTGGPRSVAAEATHAGRDGTRSSPVSANPWPTFGIELLVGAFVILLTVLCIWIQAQHQIELPPNEPKPHLRTNPFFNALGWVVFITSLVVVWRRLLRERCLKHCGYRIGWRIAVVILALVIVVCQFFFGGVAAMILFMWVEEFGGQRPMSFLFWPILTLVYPICDVILTRWRRNKIASGF